MRSIADAPRGWRREVETIVSQMQVLLSGVDGRTITVECKDGYTVRATFPEVRKTEYVSAATIVCVPKESHDELAERWKAKPIGRGLFRGVEVPDIVELIWEHHGVNLAASRSLTQGGSNGRQVT